MPNKKKNKKRFVITIAIGAVFLTLLSLYVGFHSGIVHDDRAMGFGFFRDITDGFAHMQEKPLAILPLSKWSFMYAGFWLFVTYGTAIAFIIIFKKSRYDKDATGTARWNEDYDGYNKQYTSPFGETRNDGYDNAIMSQNVFLSLDGHKTLRNSNVLVLGGSGSGKTRFYGLPNGMQLNGSYIFTDPKGELAESLGTLMEENGYEVKIFNLQNMNKSLTYNPYMYIRDAKGVRQMAECIVHNTQEEGKKGSDPFWDSTFKVLLEAVSHYLLETKPPEKRNFANVMRLLRKAKVDDQNSNKASEFDKLFQQLAKVNPQSQAVKSYKAFRIASGNTLKSILVTVMTRLEPFDIPEVADLTSTDTIHLEEIGRKRQALFIIIPEEDTTYNFIAATLYTQLFERLYYDSKNVFPYGYLFGDEKDTFLFDSDKDKLAKKVAAIPNCQIKLNDDNGRYEVIDPNNLINPESTVPCVLESFLTEKSANWWLNRAKSLAKGNFEPYIKKGGRRLPYNVRMILDEYANIGKIPGFQTKLATVRSYGISCSIIVQNLGQITSMYDQEVMETIVGQCDSFLFLGSPEKKSLEYIVSILGKTTKTQRSYSMSSGKGGNESRQVTTVDLMPYDQVREMPNDVCIYFLRGEKPFKDYKYDIKTHPNYKNTAMANPDLQYIIPYDNSKKRDSEKDEEIVTDEKSKLLKKRSKSIPIGQSLEDLFLKICSPADEKGAPDVSKADPDKLKDNIAIYGADHSVADTKEKVDSEKENRKADEETREKKVDMWDIVSDMTMF